jgi:hypothetical protein
MDDIVRLLRLIREKTKQGDEFVTGSLALYLDDLITELYKLPDYADLVELYEEELDNYNHPDDILKATNRLLDRISDEKKAELVEQSFKATTIKLLDALVGDELLDDAAVEAISVEFQKQLSSASVARGLTADGAGGGDAVSVLNKLAEND